MKRLTRFAGPSVLFGFAALPLVACFSSDSTEPGVTTTLPPGDAAALSTDDATISVGTDGGSNDAGPEATTVVDPDAAPGPLTVRVLVAGAPEAGVLIVFQDATGAVLSTATTDATGTVSQLVVPGSQLTAVMGTTQNPNLVTVQDVEDGDALTLLDTSAGSPGYDVPTVDVTLPAATWDASSQVYMNAGPCGDPQGYPLYVTPDCSSQGTYPVFARASGNAGEIAYTYQTGNPLGADAGALAVDVTRPWSTSTVNETIAASSVPVDDGGTTFGDVSFDYTEVAGGVPLSLGSFGPTTSDGGLPSEAFVVHSGYPEFTQEDAVLTVYPQSSSLAEVFAVTRTAPATASRTTSLALGTLPAFTSASVNAGDDAGTPQQPVVGWTTSGPLSAANGLVSILQWYAPPPDGGDESIYGTWMIVAPATATSLRAPSMPPSASAFTPSAGASFNPPTVAAISAPFIAGYSVFKSQFATIPIFTSNNWQPTIPVLPANGLTLYASVIYPDEG